MHKPSQLRSIVGPAGGTARPVLRDVRVGNEVRTEAHYTDPNTGQFITKVTVSTRPVNEPK